MTSKNTRLAGAVAAVVFLNLLAVAQDVPRPPVAERSPHKTTRHGEEVVDQYFWLREKTHPKTIAYLEAENAYTEALTAPLAPFVAKLKAEMIARLTQNDVDAPVKDGAFHYYERKIEGKQYGVFCRRPAAEDGSYDDAAKERILLDENVLAEGKPFLSIGGRAVADDGSKLAYLVDETGFRQFVLRIKDLPSDALLADTAERVTSLVWADAATLFFTTEDPLTKRSDSLWRLRLGEKPTLVYREADELFDVALKRTKDRRFVVLRIQSTDTWERLVLDTAKLGDVFRPLLPRETGHKYDFEHRDGVYYIRTNKDAKQFRLVSAPASDPSPSKWKDVRPHDAETFLADFELCRDFLVTTETRDGLNRFRVFDFADGEWRNVKFPDPAYAAFVMDGREYASPTFRIAYETPAQPRWISDIYYTTLYGVSAKVDAVGGGFDGKKYAVERAWATARDGVKIPLTLVSRKDVPRDGTAPLWLYGYGSYGYGEVADFDRDRVSILDRGVVFAIAHVRGGDEKGETWHDDGMLMKKKNTFFDFIDCAEWLVKEKRVARDRIAIEGFSAGGLLMGAVVNMRPDLWRAAHLGVPFVDVMNTMTDPTLPLTVGEYLEWGDPSDKAAYDYMRSYSPYDNLVDGAYPAMLVTTSLNDSQVMYWEPAKYVAKLRTLKKDATPLLLKTHMKPAGHGGASGRFDRVEDRAFVVAWMLSQLGFGD